MMTMPAFECYTDHSSGNYGINSLRFIVDGRSYWFSYKTLIAFTDGHGNRYVRANDWGPTTGRHLNAIDGGNKTARLSSADFQAAYDRTHPDTVQS